MTGDAGLQGHELVVHVFVAADADVDPQADRRWVAELWDRCVAAFGLDDAEPGYPTEPGALPGEETEEAVLAVRTWARDGLYQVALRRRHDVLALSLVLAPDPARDVRWAELEAWWAAIQRPPTRGVLGSARILQAQLAGEAALLDAPARPEAAGAGVLVDPPGLGPFAVWEAPGPDERADRRLVVVAAADRDDRLSAWTWSRGTGAMTPLANYLLAAAKLRYEVRVQRSARPSTHELNEEADQVGTDVANGAAGAETAHRMEMRLVDRRTRLDDMRRTASIAAWNMTLHVPSRAGGPFADDRGVAEWFREELGNEIGYLGAALERVRSVAAATAFSAGPVPLDVPPAVRTLVHRPDASVRDLFPQVSVLGEPPELEAVVRRAVGFQNVVVFAEGLLRAAARVCRVTVVRDSGRSSGTGFLVGPDLVLTNHHVLGGVLDSSTPPDRVRCTFDYHLRSDGTFDDGSRYGLAAEGWLVAARPPSPHDAQREPHGEPEPHELDYALVRLGAAPGRDRLPNGARRGWLDLAAAGPVPAVGTPLLIIQHPDEEVIKLALDTDGVLRVDEDGTRMTYGVNTVRGSSGSPCFTFDLVAVAVHHAGGGALVAGRNEGVPLATVVADLRDRGVELPEPPGAGPSEPRDRRHTEESG